MKAAEFARVGLAEAIGQLEAMPSLLEGAIESVPDAHLAWRPAAGEFSLREQACHLRDVEREGYLARVRRMLTEPGPELVPFDGAAVAAERNYPAQDAKRAAQDFGAARRELLGLIAPLTGPELAREGTFGGKAVCLADVISMAVEHDRGHREEIRRLLDAAAGA